MKRRKLISILAALLLIAFPATVTAQETGDEGNFVSQLARELQESGWDEAEVEALVNAARELDWEEARGANPETVALAMQLSRQQSNENEASQLNIREQARVARELAVSARMMEQAGFDDQEVARAAFNGAREVTAEVRAWHEEGRTDNLGERIRRRVAESVREQVRNAENIEARKRFRRNQTDRQNLPSDPPGSGPDNPGPGS